MTKLGEVPDKARLAVSNLGSKQASSRLETGVLRIPQGRIPRRLPKTLDKFGDRGILSICKCVAEYK